MMNGGYLLALASQPAGQVLLQQADRAFSLLQRSLEAADTTGVSIEVPPPNTGTDVEDKSSWPLNSVSTLLKRAGSVGTSLRSGLLKSVSPGSSIKVAKFIEEKRGNIDTLKLKGLELMADDCKVEIGEHLLTRAVFWPVARVVDFMNRISRPYVLGEEERVPETSREGVRAVQTAHCPLETMEEEDTQEPGLDDSCVSWKTSAEELGVDAEEEPEDSLSPSRPVEDVAVQGGAQQTTIRGSVDSGIGSADDGLRAQSV